MDSLVLRGAGGGRFEPAETILHGQPPSGSALLDADGDGDLDLVTAETTSRGSTAELTSYLLDTRAGGDGCARFARGEVTGDGRRNVTDPVVLLGHLFAGSPLPCADAADIDDDGRLLITDPILLLGFLFLGGPQPSPPFPGCGDDPNADALPPCAGDCR